MKYVKFLLIPLATLSYYQLHSMTQTINNDTLCLASPELKEWRAYIHRAIDRTTGKDAVEVTYLLEVLYRQKDLNIAIFNNSFTNSGWNADDEWRFYNELHNIERFHCAIYAIRCNKLELATRIFQMRNGYYYHDIEACAGTDLRDAIQRGDTQLTLPIVKIICEKIIKHNRTKFFIDHAGLEALRDNYGPDHEITQYLERQFLH